MADETSKRSGDETSSDTTKKSTTKTSAKKSPAKKTSTKKASSGSRSGQSRARAPRTEPGRKLSGSQVAEAAVRQLAELTSKDVEGVTGLRKDDDGWEVELEVLELRRIPTTTDVMATYEVRVDASGDLEGYRRVSRYVRGQAEGGS